ncbi:MAG TPA: aminotransferase class III-fold pyridoxal phosphate-dependent enzyme, partial [Chromatiaceae bacterium]|nr:aminotransferase class III-fold pyridoxal phosphate-dependent enzyme [Chromatiaceae bacterium]
MHPDWLQIDRDHVWHPYSNLGSDAPVFAIASANGVRLRLEDGRELIDGMASWWCAIHGYNHPVLNQAINNQLQRMAHVMFGGLTHEPGARLAQRLVELTPDPLQSVFFSDSGSVAVEVAMKMAMQYWIGREQPTRQRFITLRHGYHGDTLGAMSVCDPVTGMHSMFAGVLPQQVFVDAPTCPFGGTADRHAIDAMREALNTHQDQ